MGSAGAGMSGAPNVSRHARGRDGPCLTLHIERSDLPLVYCVHNLVASRRNGPAEDGNQVVAIAKAAAQQLASKVGLSDGFYFETVRTAFSCRPQQAGDQWRERDPRRTANRAHMGDVPFVGTV